MRFIKEQGNANNAKNVWKFLRLQKQKNMKFNNIKALHSILDNKTKIYWLDIRNIVLFIKSRIFYLHMHSFQTSLRNFLFILSS